LRIWIAPLPIAVLSLAAVTTHALAADAVTSCNYHEEPGTAAKVTKSKVDLQTVVPAEGGELTKSTVIEVDVEYQVAEFEPKTFRLFPMFVTEGFGSMSPLDAGKLPFLESAAGKVHLCVPLDRVYEHPTVEWPLSMFLMLLRERADGGGKSAAWSRKVKFKALDTPEEALARQAMALPVEYHDALNKVSVFFDNRQAGYKACIARFPAMQPALTKSYRAWENRHREAIDLVNGALFDKIMKETRGREDIAAKFYDVRVEAMSQGYKNWPSTSLKQTCDGFLEDFSDNEDISDNAITDELVILRRYYPAQPVEKQK